MKIVGTTETFPEVQRANMMSGRFFTEQEVKARRKVIVLGQGPYLALFEFSDPIGKTIRMGPEQYSVIGVLQNRPSLGGFNLGQDDIGVVPETTYQKQFGLRLFRDRMGEHRAIMIVIVPRPGLRERAMAEVEEIMRVRHNLRIDSANDFDLITQDAALKVWDQVTSATFLALVVISSIALLVGGIGVMAIMTISVTERTREIGVRKALGARRREILWQFLMEAAFLTSLGGVLGIMLGSAIGWGVHWISGFPISLPWWSFAIGLGFSASVGIFFGMWPAVKASRLDPIEALRYE
jgi:putative ABC transport system permease protein